MTGISRPWPRFVIRKRGPDGGWCYSGPGGWGPLGVAATYSGEDIKRLSRHIRKEYGEAAVELQTARREDGDGGTV